MAKTLIKILETYPTRAELDAREAKRVRINRRLNAAYTVALSVLVVLLMILIVAVGLGSSINAVG